MAKAWSLYTLLPVPKSMHGKSRLPAFSHEILLHLPEFRYIP